MLHRLATIALPVALAAVLVLPSAAIACSIAAPTIGTHPATRAEIAVPIRHTSARAAWGVRDPWISIRPGLVQFVPVVGATRQGIGGVARRTQRTLGFVGGNQRGLRTWADDEDPATTCAVVGAQVYARPRLLVRETSAAVFVTFVTRRAAVVPPGCVATAPGSIAQPASSPVGASLDSCADLAIGRTTLRRPLGDRNLVLDWFAPAAAPAA
jgi:hypothetical protein